MEKNLCKSCLFIKNHFEDTAFSIIPPPIETRGPQASTVITQKLFFKIITHADNNLSYLFSFTYWHYIPP